MVPKLIIRWWFRWYHFQRVFWKSHLISSSHVTDHSIVMVHWYGKWMTSISFWLRIWYHQKCSHSTSILTCRVCISPRAPLDNSDNHSIPCTYTGQPYYCVHALGGSQWSSLRMDVMWLWHELYPWRTMLLMRFFRHLSPEGCLSHWIQMCSWLRALVLSMVIIWLKCVVYVQM